MEDRDPVVDEVREHFTLKTLQEKVGRLEAENKELHMNNSILDTQYKSQCETQSDILRTLHANLDENCSQIEDFKHQVFNLERQIEELKADHKEKIEEETRLWELKVQELQVKNDHLTAALNEVEEFRKNKEGMEAELKNLKQNIQDQADNHSNILSANERKKAIQIDQLKNDMARSIKETREMLKARTKDQLDSTTKRTIMENEQMATELHFQSKETERLLDKNRALLEENAQLRRHLHIHKDLENELARRTHVYQKLIKKMHQQNKQRMETSLQSTNSHTHSDDEESVHEDSRAAEMDSQMVSAVKEESVRLQAEVQEMQNTLKMVRHEFAQYRRDHATLTQLQDQSTRLVIGALYELKNERECDPFPPASYDENASWQFTNMTNRQKEYFFRVLLEKMNSSMCGSCFPTGPHASPQVCQPASLPKIGKDAGDPSAPPAGGQGNFSQFLWSVASPTAAPPASASRPRKDVSTAAVQTETDPTDPCFKEGLWNPQTRARHTEAALVTPSMVTGKVRSWGASSLTGRPRPNKVQPRLI
mmetsp:Transcript_46614/g.110847  ORF Transcript_46614/g.110847 Transcript_46614/m.110847 type:complete len:538 (+) Transcript_46614:145-1758(+)